MNSEAIASDGTPAVSARAEQRDWIHGRLETHAIGRAHGGNDDLDLYQVLVLDVGDSTRDRWSGHLSARAAWDLDGADANSTFFASLSDAQNGRLDLALYDAYAEVQRVGPLARIRFGRQFLYDAPIVAWFDGAYAELAERGSRRWTAGLYGGLPVHLYEGSERGDRLLGGFASLHPWRGSVLRADWMHVEDERAGFDGGNDLVGLSLDEEVNKNLRWQTRVTRLDDHDRDVTVSAYGTDAASGFSWNATYYRLLATTQEEALELDPFFAQLLTLFPFEELRVSLSKDFGAVFNAVVGASLRAVNDPGDEGPFNRDFARAYATATWREALPGKTTLALTAERWQGGGSGVDSWGVDLSKRFESSIDVGVGSAFALYRFDPFLGDEQNDVRTYYVSLRWRRTKELAFDLRGEVEDHDLGTSEQVRLGVTWRF
ncbi:MAG: hypothetical protein K8S98_05095 [Planctomycetes bacterium]|nr:hypothetical protein [Planctomycetota bacterium]